MSLVSKPISLSIWEMLNFLLVRIELKLKSLFDYFIVCASESLLMSAELWEQSLLNVVTKPVKRTEEH